MTIAELQAYVGAPPPRPGSVYFTRRGDFAITAWLAPFMSTPDAPIGWWWAAVQPCGEHEIVVAMGWSLGRRVVDRDADIARSLTARHETAVA